MKIPLGRNTYENTVAFIDRRSNWKVIMTKFARLTAAPLSLALILQTIPLASAQTSLGYSVQRGSRLYLPKHRHKAGLYGCGHRELHTYLERSVCN